MNRRQKKACERFRLAGAGRIEEHSSLYQVDGEVGRFTFKTYDVKGGDKKSRFKGIEMFPARQGKEWHSTCGFKEIAVMLGAARCPFRQADQLLNRSRHQEVGGTPLNTLRDGAEAQGKKVLDFLDRKSKNVLNKHGFDPQGLPRSDCTLIEQIPPPSYLEQEALQPALAAVIEDMGKRGIDAEDVEFVREVVGAHKIHEMATTGTENVKNALDTNETYEEAEQCVYVSIDDVMVNEQKEHRNKKGSINEPSTISKDATEDKRPMVPNTVARIEHNGNGFTLTGRSLAEVLVFVLGFLLNKGLFSKNIKICIDGQRSLQGGILAFFAWHPHLTLLLDWFHVVKKFKEDLSLACRGREIRNRHLKRLLTLVWFGLNDKAQTYLAAIPAEDVKDSKAILRLIGYLERNRKWMPCYSMRSKLNLPNSSNPVERCNNLVTAKRQKHHGMSWSEAGSHAITALNAVASNNAVKQWVQNQTIDLDWAKRAA